MATDSEKQEAKRMIKPISDKCGVSDEEVDALFDELSFDDLLPISSGIPCEVIAEFLNSYCEACFRHGEEAHTEGVSRKNTIVWVLRNKQPVISCTSCVVAGWNHASETEKEEREEK